MNFSNSFAFTGSAQSFTVPPGITAVTFTGVGARGGAGGTPEPRGNVLYPYAMPGKNGGYGGTLTAMLIVTGGQALSIFVGGVGNLGAAGPYFNGAGGYNGGGNGGATGDGQNACNSPRFSTVCFGGGGGGATDIRTGPAASDRLAVAAGGGGGGGGALTLYQGHSASAGLSDDSGTASGAGGAGNTGGTGTSTYATFSTYGAGGGGGGGGFLGGDGGAGGYSGYSEMGGGGGGSGGTNWAEGSAQGVTIQSGTNPGTREGDGRATVQYTALDGDLGLDVSSSSISADGISTFTATMTLAAGITPISGQNVQISTTGGLVAAAVNDLGNGTYTATVKAGRSAGAASVVVSIGGLTVTQPITVTPAAPAHVFVSADPASSTTGAIVTAIVTDASLNPISGQSLAMSSSITGQITPVTDMGDGTYTARVAAAAQANVVTATLGPISGSTTIYSRPADGSVTSTRAFPYTGAAQTWSVPSGVTSAAFTLNGARGGGANSYSTGGSGGRVSATVPVIGGQQLKVMVGGAGENFTTAYPNNSAGFNGGGTGCGDTRNFGSSYCGIDSGPGGGGATDIRISALSDRLLVAGGGGGAGGQLSGMNLYSSYWLPAHGGGADEGDPALFGVGGMGLRGYDSNYQQYQGGGGGGGYRGGTGATTANDTSGRGGSSYAAASGPFAASAVTKTAAVSAGNGSATVTYQQPATLRLALSSPTAPASGTSTVTATATLVNPNGDTPITGSTVTIGAGSGAQVSGVTPRSDGTYTATITTTTHAGAVTVTAGAGALTRTATLTQLATSAALTLSAPQVIADGASTVTATATYTDGAGNGAAGEPVTIIDLDSHALVGPVTDNGDGRYTAVIASTLQLGTDSISTSNTSVSATASLAVVPGPLASFTYSTSGDSVAGVPQSVTVSANDAFGHLATAYTGAPQITKNLHGAPRGCGADGLDGCTHSVGVTPFVAGVATLTFVGHKAETGRSISLTSGSVTAALPDFSITPAPFAGFDVNVPPTVASGQSVEMVVRARDAFGNLISGYVGSVAVTSRTGSAGASLPAPHTFTLAEAGAHTFSASLQTPGPHDLTATDAVAGISGSATVAVSTATLSSLVVTPASTSLVFSTRMAPIAFRVTGSYSDGANADVSSQATWSSSGMAAVVDAAGTVTIVAAGSATIRASLAGVVAQAPITVTAPAVSPGPFPPVTPVPPAEPSARKPDFSSARRASMRAGVRSSFRVVTVAAQPTDVELSVVGALPRGVTFTDLGDGTGRISGTPTRDSAGVRTVAILATNAAGARVQQLALAVTAPPRFTSAARVGARRNETMSFQVTTSGYPDATIKTSALPWWLHMTVQEDGSAQLSGTPLSRGRHHVTITATGSAGKTRQVLLIVVR